eukprot:CAMPEP_0194367234 /NCGR_PEP_ID=MMETSP0174-20130528/15271_1 /TAXON_ID=216777 /ORGANISM="Proboscia alata, Strain PI-D3" /LENGTH=387 /DNA_ID=CAMNT_0039142833 /DNA_START=66 /DNA_END=1229 /DNA_ORIENTATION=+
MKRQKGKVIKLHKQEEEQHCQQDHVNCFRSFYLLVISPLKRYTNRNGFVFLIMLSVVAVVATNSALQDTLTYKSSLRTSSKSSPSFNVPQEEVPLSLSSSCMARSFHSLCFFFDTNTHFSLCQTNPKRFLENQFQKHYQPSQAEMNAQDILQRTGIRSISIGSDKIGICNDVKVGATLCTERENLDLFKIYSWLSILQGTKQKKGSTNNNATQDDNHVEGLESIFAEHVLEHFSPTQITIMAAASYAVLKPGGVFRIAVPDGYKPSPSYQEYIRAGGTASGTGQNHMAAYTIDNLAPIFRNLGYEISAQEYFEQNGTFVSQPDAYIMDDVLGKVRRSNKHDGRNKLPYRNWNGVLDSTDRKSQGEPMYTSLWFDAVKPKVCKEIITF